MGEVYRLLRDLQPLRGFCPIMVFEKLLGTNQGTKWLKGTATFGDLYNSSLASNFEPCSFRLI